MKKIVLLILVVVLTYCSGISYFSHVKYESDKNIGGIYSTNFLDKKALKEMLTKVAKDKSKRMFLKKMNVKNLV